MSMDFRTITRTRQERILAEKVRTSKRKRVTVAKYALAGTIATSAFMNVHQLGVGKVQACSSVYTVQKGDTLHSLSKQFHVTVEQIQNRNELNSAQVKIGQKLELPGAAFYKVVSGDTLFQIAEKHKTTINEIKTLNQMATDLIKVDQTLIMPNADEESSTFKPVKSQPSSNVYTVVSGDTLSKIARLHQTSVKEIKTLNGLTSDLIKVGQKLQTPPVTKQEKQEHKMVEKYDHETVQSATYTAVPGDTIWGISERFNTPITEIKRNNDLKSDVILIGQKLVIAQSNIIKTRGIVVGAVDSKHVAFTVNNAELVLKVPYGQSEKYEKLAGETVEIVYQAGEAPVLINYI